MSGPGQNFRPLELDSNSAQPKELSNVQVRSFQPRDFAKDAAPLQYQQVKEKFGGLAQTDEDANSHFQLHPAAKQLLGVEQEELSHIEDRVQEEVRSRLSLLEKQAYDAGFKKGVEDGRKEAEEAARAEFSPMQEKLNGLLNAFDSIKEDLFHSNERVLIQLIYSVAREVILKELKADPDYVKRLAAEVIEKVGAKDSVRVKVSRDDFANIESIRDFLKTTFPELKNIQIEPSEDLVLGGCKVETDLSRINASVETQLKAIEGTLTAI